MKLSSFPPSSGIAVQPNVRCLAGLYGSLKDSSMEDLNRLLEEDQDEQEILRYAINHEESDEVRFLVGSQSLKPQGSQITLVTLVESLDIDLKKQIFSHPDGEIISLVTLASKPDWFISLFASYSSERPELRTGARMWRVPSSNESLLDDEENELNSPKSLLDHNSSTLNSCTLEYVTTLPLDKFCGIKRITSHPSTTCSDLACIVGPPTELPGSNAYPSLITTSTTSYLVILQAPSDSNSGDYAISTSGQLYLPPSSTTDGLRSNMKLSSSCLSATVSPNAIRWSPHEQLNQIAMAFDNGILGWDVRCMKPCFWMENAHWPCVRDLDYNPHRPNLLLSGGDDGILRIWDLRYLRTRYRCLSTPANTGNMINPTIPNASERIMQFGTEPTVQPLYALSSHSHWIWSVRYHPTRDQLVLSSGSDGRVCLYNLPSYSSDAMNEDIINEVNSQSIVGHCETTTTTDVQSEVDNHSIDSNEEENDVNKDGLIARLEQHEESVYAAEWSPVDAWYFASISYDGNFLLNRVPETIKLNILLQSKDY
uniref:WD_REPEATS_REGION domain-containing protein n=1 Tax=Trichobilharzia regenti TaxID=157069 RepID=A0AA85JRH1_TRIRE|nr:unnamed protein product [Trichobilharzia regenti]